MYSHASWWWPFVYIFWYLNSFNRAIVKWNDSILKENKSLKVLRYTNRYKDEEEI